MNDCSYLVVDLCCHLSEHVVEPEDVGPGLELLPGVVVGPPHQAVDVELVVSAGCKEGGVLSQVVEDGATVLPARQPRQREVDDGRLDAQRVDAVYVAGKAKGNLLINSC